MSNVKIRFLGGAGTVTGSKFLVEGGERRILVDCGMFQGLKELRLQNWTPFPISCESIQDVILTHAHLDHTGYLPLLVKQGFRGTIHCSEPTLELTELLLRDAAKIQEEEAQRANEQGYSKHKPARPLYGISEVEKSLTLFKTHRPNTWFDLGRGARFRFEASGHILGSVFVELEYEERKLVFSGDLGRSAPITLNPPTRIAQADVLFIESTYGDRRHSTEKTYEHLGRVIREVTERHGVILIPSFAVGRTQDVLHLIAGLRKNQSIPEIPVFLDSPMAIRATEIFDKYSSWHRLNKGDLQNLQSVAQMVTDGEHSKRLQKRKEPAIIIAGSGMLTGGRILDHLETRISDPKNAVILVGFQAAGTLGRFLKEGADELKIRRQYYPVKAQIEDISSLSAHADQHEILHWLSSFDKPPKKIFIVHGEPHAADALRVRIKDELGWEAEVARFNEVKEIP